MKTPILPVLWLCTLGLAKAAVTYGNFADTTGLALNGDAYSDGTALHLTYADGDSSGSVFTTTQQPLGAGNSFSTYFQFSIPGSGGISDGLDGAGADGIVFVIQNVSNNVGGLGSGIGYQGIHPSLGIEFDTYYNPELGDPNGNHVGVNTDGSPVSLVTVTEPVRFNNGAVWNAWIDYQGDTGALEVRWSMDSTRPAAAGLATTVNLADILGQDSGYLGFTSATGGAWGDHQILNWDYRSEYSPIIPEPATALLGLSGVLLLARRRRSC